MEPCYVKFEPRDGCSFRRLAEFFGRVRAAKEGGEPRDEGALAEFLTDDERAHFWNPTPQEAEEWNRFWFSTPLPQRHSSAMPLPPWTFGSMLEAFWDGEYQLLEVVLKDGAGFLTFNPHSYPYGGVQSLVALVQAFGNRVVGLEDGTGYEDYAQAKTWKPSGRGGL